MSKPDNTTIADSWNTYWQGTGDVGAFSSGGVNHPAIDEFWRGYFSSLGSTAKAKKRRMVDLATGNGAVVELVLAQSSLADMEITCVDISAAAIDNVVSRFPAVTGLVADAQSIPLDDAGFDLATSQFGIEYAGLHAVLEAARLVTAGGSLAMVLHIEDGVVHRECAANLNAVRELQAAKFVSLALDFFRAGFAAVRGADRRAYDDAGRALAPAIETAENILRRYGKDIAGETIFRLYNDVGNIHSQLIQYAPEDVLGWLEKMDNELIEYAERMSSMIASATSVVEFESLCDRLVHSGFDVSLREPLLPKDSETPVAWALVATKRLSE